MRTLRALAAVLALTLVSCAAPRGGYYGGDGPDRHPPDVSSIPDATPRTEPRAKSGNQPYRVNGHQYVPLADARDYHERGIASWYGKKFHGRRTSSGEPYDMYAMTAAHKTLPLPSYVRVTNLDNGRSVIVRVNDRGPFLHNRVIDLSYAAAAKLDIAAHGTGVVEVEIIMPGAPIVAKSKVETFALKPPPQALVEAIPSAHVADAPAQAPRLFVQAGAFHELDNAEQLRAKLEREALGPVTIETAMGAGVERLYRVRIGPVASVEEGDALTDTLSGHGVTDTLIVVE